LAGRNRADVAALGVAHHAAAEGLVGRQQSRLPTLKAGAGLEGRFGEIEDSLPGITASPHRVIGQDELTDRRIPAVGVWADGRAGQAIGHRIRVRKERGLLEFRTPRPEADADLLGIAAYRPNDAGTGWGCG